MVVQQPECWGWIGRRNDGEVVLSAIGRLHLIMTLDRGKIKAAVREEYPTPATAPLRKMR